MTRDTVLGTCEYRDFVPIGTVLSMDPDPKLLFPIPSFTFELTGRTLVIDLVYDGSDSERFAVIYPDGTTLGFSGHVREEIVR